MNLGAFAGGMAGGLSTGIQLRGRMEKDARMKRADERKEEEHEWKRAERDALNRAFKRFGSEVMPLSFRQDGSNAPLGTAAPMESLALKPAAERPGFGPAGTMAGLSGYGLSPLRVNGMQGFAQGGLVGLSDEAMAQNRQRALAEMQGQQMQGQQAAPAQEVPKEAVMQQLWDSDALNNPDKLTAMARILQEEGLGEKMLPWLERAYEAKKTNKVAGAMKLLQGDVDGAIDALAQGGVKLADRPVKIKPNDPHDTRWKINIEGAGEQEMDLNQLIATTMDPEKYLKWSNDRTDTNREFGLKESEDKRKERDEGRKDKELGFKRRELGLKERKTNAEIGLYNYRARGGDRSGAGLGSSADRPEKIDASMKMRYSTIDDLSSVKGDDGKYHVDPKKRMAYSSLAVDSEEEITSRLGRELTAKEHHRLTDLLRTAPLNDSGRMEQWWAQAERRFFGGRRPEEPDEQPQRQGSKGGGAEPGNIDLDNRPVVKNRDGSISTVRSMSFNEDGMEVLIPTIRDDGKVMTEDEAIAHYRKTGRHLGKFATPEEATAYAKQLSASQGRQFGVGAPAQTETPIASPRAVGLAALKEQQAMRDRMSAVQRALQNPNLNTEQKKVLALQAQQIATEIDAYNRGR